MSGFSRTAMTAGSSQRGQVMAKRKAARATRRKTAGARAGARGKRTAARKAGARTGASKKTARKATRSGGRTTARKASAKGAARTSSARKAVGRKATAPKAAGRKAPARKAPPRAAKQSAARPAPKPVVARKAPALERERRTMRDDDIVPTPPSSLDLDRRATAVRSGRRELREKFNEHTETSPALTGGDVDADWESAYSVGDEAPGGDNPTPDQDIVDDIGRAVGNEYQDTEELKGADKIAKRDKHRWELDPASSEDYDDRD
jgi:hypothetical protein